jgi:S1-C subfamily serine protease
MKRWVQPKTNHQQHQPFFKPKLLLVPILVLAVLALAACGQGASASPTPAAVAATSFESPVVVADAVADVVADTVADAVDVDTSGAGDAGGPVIEPDSPDPAQGYLSTVEVVKILSPSVVQVVTESSAMGLVNQPVPSQGVGTGVILDVEGNILTNNHVVAGAQAIMVTLNNGESYTAQIVGMDANTDTAVIRIDAEGLQPATLGRSGALQPGEEVIAIGHALGLPGGPTVSKGVVSALGRSIDVDARTTMVDLIQTDASINPGNSGGPLANSKGEVIGINTAVIRGSQGIGFAINIDDVKFVVAQLLEKGYVNRGFLGITPFNLSPGLANQLGVPVTSGVAVAGVVPGSAAAAARLETEDVIVRLGSEEIGNTGELSRFLIAHPPGETVEVVFYRGNEERSVQLTLGERPAG